MSPRSVVFAKNNIVALSRTSNATVSYCRLSVMRLSAVEHLLYQFVLLLPNIAKPALHITTVASVIFVITIDTPGRHCSLPDIDDNLHMPPATHIPELRRAIG